MTQDKTKVIKLKELYNMRSNKAESIVSLIDDHIPDYYTNVIIERCKKRKISVNSQLVRNVKTFRKKDAAVLAVILEFARENKKAAKKLEEYVTE
ncbi:hypothetical protein J0871_16710 [Salegentibacter sp. BDJ18]|uniref:hypothetical protein n=1 Tax=Salegentibacter sp. BDJ18 TaxID=2816376 RepID=UPI001AAE7612|nr:hypothetical protein [Salegentibacter sp. BDJ18]MBO2546060.1 hypothetical protein [Salegentibacter sp. BDJ18]